MNIDKFSDVLSKLAERIDEKVSESTDKREIIVNRVDLQGFKHVVQTYLNDRSLCKKTLNVNGKWRLNVEYGPLFETQLKTERAGAITVQTDTSTIFGGGGTALNPIQLCMAGFCGCFSAAFAKWTAMEGIKLNDLKIRTRADLDITSTLGIKKNVPIVDNYEIEFIIDTDAQLEELEKAIELTKERCFCHYCITNPIFPEFELIKVQSPDAHKAQDNHQVLNNAQIENLNRVNVKSFKDTQEMYKQNPALCKQVLEVEGNWRLGVEYGPQFEIKLETEKAGEITIQTDETIILGGGGTSFHPVALCIAGFSASVCTEFARLTALEGIELRRLETQAKMDIDLTTSFGIEDDIPMIDRFKVDIIVESDASAEQLKLILDEAKERAFCIYCYMTPIIPNVYIRTEEEEKDKFEKKEREISEEPTDEIKPLEPLYLDQIHNIKDKTTKEIKMTLL